MFKKLKRLISKQDQDDSTKPMCSINFELNYDGTVNIICYWPNFNESNIDKMDIVSTEFSRLLFSLEQKSIKKDIVQTLTNLTRPNNLYDSLFVNLVLKKWVENMEKNEPESSFDGPMIRPSSVFNK